MAKYPPWHSGLWGDHYMTDRWCQDTLWDSGIYDINEKLLKMPLN